MAKLIRHTLKDDQEFEKYVEAWLASKKLDDIEAYVAKGRRFASSETETLKTDWVETYRVIVSLAEREHDLAGWVKATDLEAELSLRNEPTPYDLVREETALYSRIIQAKRGKPRPDPGSQEEPLDEFERFLKAHKKGH